MLVAVSLVPALILLTMQAIEAYDDAYHDLDREARLIATQIGMQSKELIPEPEVFLANLATIQEVVSGGDRCAAFMQASLKANYYFGNIFVLDSQGNMICSGVQAGANLNFTDRMYFKRVMQSKKFAISDYQVSRVSGAPILVFARPVLDPYGNVTHILGVSVKLSWFQDAFGHALKKSSVKGVAATLIGEDGTILASAPDTSFAGQPARAWTDVRPLLRERESLVRDETWRSGTKRTTAYLPIYQSEMATIYLRAGVPLDGPIAQVFDTMARYFAILAFTAIAALAAAWALSFYLILKPINRLTHVAALVSQGKRDERTGLSRKGGEIGELAARFDAMVTELQSQHVALTRLSRVQALRGAINSAVLRTKSEEKLLQELCEIICKVAGFHAAWVGYAKANSPGELVIKAHYGAQRNSIERFTRQDPNGEVTEFGPVMAAITFGKVQVFHHIAANQDNGPAWWDTVAALGLRSTVALPIMAGGEIIGGLGIYSSDPEAFNVDEITLLTESTNDLGFGIYAFRASIELRRSQEFLGLIVDHIPSTIFVKDAADLRLVSLNPAGERLLGCLADEVIGRTPDELFTPEEAARFIDGDRQVLYGAGDALTLEETVQSRSGQIRVVQTTKLRLLGPNGLPKYLLGISEDITERRVANERLIHQATHDDLTGLPNRGLLATRLGEALCRATVEKRLVAVLFIDLDGFKEINDTLGHEMGDELLRTVSSLLHPIAERSGTVARVGGDEFIIVLEALSTVKEIAVEEAAKVAEEVRAICAQPFLIADTEIFISASIGISMFPAVDTAATLLRTADIAMYHAKAKGRNTYAFFSPEMKSEAIRKMALRNALRHATERNELVIHYQPRVSFLTGRIVGAEALVRWNSHELGFISPAQFIPLAEESGLIEQIGQWVLQQACRQAQEWQGLGRGRIEIAVNLSARQLRQNDILTIIRNAIDDARLDPRLLELELTESAFMDQGTNPSRLLTSISNMGVRLAIDDFGTGYSNLAYLKKLPVDVLKIDQSFVRGMTDHVHDRQIVATVVALAKALNLSVTAEGVETVEQRELLCALDCDDFQGYLFSKAVPPAEFEALLLRQESNTSA
nr:EAL domain-containing protein [uncultured Noviherbaspirillum sp.]